MRARITALSVTVMAIVLAPGIMQAQPATPSLLDPHLGDVDVVLDLAVNFASERGLLGIAVHPQFATNRAVYLRSTANPLAADHDCR